MAARHFLLIDGLDGGSTDEGHVGWFEIDAFNFSVNVPTIFDPLVVSLNLNPRPGSSVMPHWARRSRRSSSKASPSTEWRSTISR